MYVFQLAKVVQVEHEGNKKEDLQLQFIMCDFKLAQTMLCNMCRNMYKMCSFRCNKTEHTCFIL